MWTQLGTSLGLDVPVLVAAGVELAVGLVDGEGDRLAVVVHLQCAVLVDGRAAVGLGLAAEEPRRGAADHEGLAAALDVHRLVLRLHVHPVAHELLAFHLGAAVASGPIHLHIVVSPARRMNEGGCMRGQEPFG